MVLVKIKLVRGGRRMVASPPEERDRGLEGRAANQSGQEVNDGCEMAEMPDSFVKPCVAVISIGAG